jgi:hypothetical protein
MESDSSDESESDSPYESDSPDEEYDYPLQYRTDLDNNKNIPSNVFIFVDELHFSFYPSAKGQKIV